MVRGLTTAGFAGGLWLLGASHAYAHDNGSAAARASLDAVNKSPFKERFRILAGVNFRDVGPGWVCGPRDDRGCEAHEHDGEEAAYNVHIGLL